MIRAKNFSQKMALILNDYRFWQDLQKQAMLNSLLGKFKLLWSDKHVNKFSGDTSGRWWATLIKLRVFFLVYFGSDLIRWKKRKKKLNCKPQSNLFCFRRKTLNHMLELIFHSPARFYLAMKIIKWIGKWNPLMWVSIL